MTGMTISALHDIREAQRARGMASILAIGTATPPNCFHQSDFPDFYFRATKSDHITDLKDKFKRICASSGIKKRYMYLTEEILENNPSLYANEAASLNLRQKMLTGEIPELGQMAALKAVKEWGRPVSDITHIVFATSSDRIHAPSADFHLAKLLGLRRSVHRHMIYQQGCFAGGAALRLSKDLAENNSGARVLVVCADITALSFCGPSHARMGMLIGHALFGDGAAAAIVGAVESTCLNPTSVENKFGLRNNGDIERPLFQMVSARQTFEPDTEDSILGELTESGFLYWLSRNIPSQVGCCVGKIMEEAFAQLGISDWNSLFYAIHPGGKAVLDQVEEKLGLRAEKLRASRHVLSEYGNMWAPSVLFALDQVRNMAKEERKATTGDGFEWGVLMAFGPGFTIETIVLRSEVSP